MARLTAGESLTFEVEHVHKDGHVFSLEVFANAINIAGKTVIQCFHRDITERKTAEKKVAAALDRLHKIADQVPGMIYQYRLRPDGNSCFPYASDKILEIYRVSPEQVQEDASEVFVAIHPDDYNGVVESIQTSARDLTLWKHEYRVKFNDGTVRWLIGQAVPQKDPDGSVLWHGFINDITERRETEEKLHFVTENSTNMFYSHTPDHVLNYLSPQIKNILGYEIEEAFKNWTELATDHPANQQGLEITERAIKTGEAQPPYELQLRHKDGHLVWVEVHEAPAVESGKTVAIVGSITDITDRKEAEEKLKASREFLQSTIDGLSAHIALLDENGSILLVNKAWRDFAEQNGLEAYKANEGSNYIAACESATGSCSSNAIDFSVGLRAVLAGQKDSFRLEYPCSTKTKDYWFAANVSRLDQDNSHRAVVFHTDITAAKTAEAALKQKMAELEFFNKAAVGRELRMIELKDEINALCRELGRPEKYD
jgi:PAS domain S-box-containing protein